MEKVTTSSKEAVATKAKVDGILYQLETFLEKFIDEVKKSYALHKIGEKTELVENIEEIIGQTRIDNLYNFSKGIDNQILYIIDDVVVKFFKINKDIINSVYKIKVQNKLNQYYLIVLKEDSIENRDKIFSFLDSYDTTEISVKYPVILKFTDEETLSGFFIEKKIDL
jgi:hypothetical protein